MKILQTIKALLAKAASTTNMAEAAAFAAKANELMEKYQVDIDAIHASDDPVGRDYAYETKARTKTWQMRLAAACARYYGCKVVYTFDDDNKYKVDIFGRESARITSMEMNPYFIKTVNAMARDMAKKTGWDGYKCAKQIGLELAQRLRSLAPPLEASNNPVVAGKNALVRMDEIKALVENVYPTLKPGRASKFSTTQMARDYANSVSLASQMGSRSALKIGAR